MNKPVRIIIAAAVLIAIILIVAMTANHVLGGPTGTSRSEWDFEVQPGYGPNKIVAELRRNNLIRSRSYFMFLVKLTGNSGKLKFGLYPLNRGMSSWQILRILVSGKIKMLSFTIAEGYHNRQVADVLVRKKIVGSRQEFFAAADNPAILKKYGIPADSSEGYLFPDTYRVPYNCRVERVIDMMLRNFFANLKKIDGAEADSAVERHKKIILASIVEREARRNEERPLMAGVFMNRLKKNMPLQSCATVQYLFDRQQKKIYESQLKKESPYNTYLHEGLPKGPISNPGLPSLRAAWTPEQTEYLYFLVKPDGSHFFGKTASEHFEAKRKYIDGK